MKRRKYKEDNESENAEPEETIERPAEEEEQKADFEWDLNDTRYNIGEKVFNDGQHLKNIKTDSEGVPADPALKKAYENNYLKKKE